jgi:uncharacterized protein YndB with AHSA1/START domain
MSTREDYMPGTAAGAEIRKDGEKWTLVIIRELRHPPALVWKALTDPASLREWAPLDADRSLAATGPVKLTTVGTPTPQISDTRVTRADAPHLLEYRWGDHDLRWQLESLGDGTRLTLWHHIDRGFIAMGAAGWYICFDVLDRFLADNPIGRIVAGEAMKFGWPRLYAEYAQQFGIQTKIRKRLEVEDDNMNDSDPTETGIASERIDQRIAELGDWRGETLSRMRKLIKEAAPNIVEEWKWVKPTNPGTPVWSLDGIICTGESYKSVVKLTFAKGAALADPAKLFNSSLDGNVRRAIDIRQGEEIDTGAFKALIAAAVALNASGGKARPKRAK